MWLASRVSSFSASKMVVHTAVARSSARIRTPPQGQFAITLFAALAQLERDMIGERTSAALQERWRRDGNIGRIPFGFQRTDTGVVIDDMAAVTVRRIFQLARRGLSLRAIASALNALGVPSPRTGRAWHHSSVRAVL